MSGAALTLQALDLLHGQGPLTTSVLAAQLGVTPEALRPALQKLTARGRAQRAGRAYLPSSGRPEVRWAITPEGENFLLEGRTPLWVGGLPHQLLCCASIEDQTVRELWARVTARYAPEATLPATKVAAYSLRDRGLLMPGAERPVYRATAQTYRLSPAGEGALERLPLLTRLARD